MQKQGLLLHGEERRFIKFMPKVIYVALETIKRLISDENDDMPLNMREVYN